MATHGRRNWATENVSLLLNNAGTYSKLMIAMSSHSENFLSSVRFMYSVDNRPFEEVMEAIGSNRMDPEARPVLIVVERKEE